MTIVADTPATVIPTGTWSIDPVWSALEFDVKKIGLVAIKGRALGFSGTIRGGDDASIDGVVDARDITTFDETRDGHLQSPDFFDSERFPELRFQSTAVRLRGDVLVVEGDLTIKGITRPVELTGQLPRRGRRRRRERPDRGRARRDGRPHRVRSRLERSGSRRQLHASERREPAGDLRRREGCLAMRILTLSGSLREGSYNTALAWAAAELAPGGVIVELYEGLGLLPPYDQDLDEGGAVSRLRRRSARAHRGGRCPADRHTRVQRLDPGGAQERDRLGVGSASGQLAPEQDGRHRRRDYRAVRRDLGPGGPAQSARDQRRAGHARRPPGLACGPDIRRVGAPRGPVRRRAPARARRSARFGGRPSRDCGLRASKPTKGRASGPSS